jgi:hypothetical protein
MYIIGDRPKEKVTIIIKGKYMARVANKRVE